MWTRLAELGRFGSVGLVAFVVDAGLFNLLRYGPGTLLEDKPLTAKALSVVAATVVAWLGHRSWTFAARRTAVRGRAVLRELVTFSAVSAGGMGIALACLGFSHYVLGLTSPLADNISANGVGLALGTAFRYLAYRHLVFPWPGRAGPALDAAATAPDIDPGPEPYRGPDEPHIEPAGRPVAHDPATGAGRG